MTGKKRHVTNQINYISNDISTFMWTLETGALKEAKENLDKEVEDLVANLQMEKQKMVFTI